MSPKAAAYLVGSVLGVVGLTVGFKGSAFRQETDLGFSLNPISQSTAASPQHVSFSPDGSTYAHV